jgi:HD superfamily phosphohydrolase
MRSSPVSSKIINDPIYGFITIPDQFIFSLINHPWFQRLRRIRQLGLTGLVYPGALHTRFQHALGAMYLMQEAISTLRQKKVSITAEEEQAVLAAILLHDIGHGPFSHSLEDSLVSGIPHEKISTLIINRLNEETGGKLKLCLAIFGDRYPKRFLHQLVSSQLDMDRLDYLRRDSFFTGVIEGQIGSERIIKMLNVSGNSLVVEQKGIYSIEKFLIARRLMYWQVYLHKTVISCETLLVNILRRARELSFGGHSLFSTPSLSLFLKGNFTEKDFERDPSLLDRFCALDDNDIMASVKVWTQDDDRILSMLCRRLTERRLLKVVLSDKPFSRSSVKQMQEKLCSRLRLSRKEAGYLLLTGQVRNNAYIPDNFKINILTGNGRLVDVAEASDLLNLRSLSKTVTKYFICYPKEFLSPEKAIISRR